MTVGSGKTLFELYERCIQHGASLRTCVGFLLLSTAWSSRVCFLKWRALGTKSRRFVCQLAPLTLPTAGTASGLWPTPTVQDGKNCGGPSQHLRNTPPLNAAVMMYPTPDVGAAKGRGAASAENRNRLGGSLNPAFVEYLMGFPRGWTDVSGPMNGPESHELPPE